MMLERVLSVVLLGVPAIVGGLLPLWAPVLAERRLQARMVTWAEETTPGATLPCVATTDVPEFKEGIARTCGPGIKTISIRGDHRRLVYTITYAADLAGRRVAKEFLYVVLDGRDHLVCITKVAENGSGGTYCVDTVGPASPEGTVS